MTHCKYLRNLFVKNLFVLLLAAMLVFPAFGAAASETETQDQLEAAYKCDEAGYRYYWYTENGVHGERIVNSSGETVYEVPEGEKIFLMAGGCFLSEMDEVQYLKKVNGEVICSSEDPEIDGFGMLDNTVRNNRFLRDGYALVYGMKESISGVSYAMGILSTTGEWIVPMSSDMPILSSGMEISSDKLETRIVYAGDGCLLLPVRLDSDEYKYDYKFYSISDNSCAGLQVVEGDGSSLSWDEYEFSLMNFQDGVSINHKKKFLFEVTKDGLGKRYSFIPEDVSISEQYGFFIMDDGEIRTFLKTMMPQTYLVNQNGVIKEFEGIKPVAAVQLSDGWLFTVVNSEGSHYYAVIDLNGEYKFEPVKTDAAYICLPDGRGLSFTDNVGQDRGPKYVIDENDGTILYESQYEDTEISVSHYIVEEFGQYRINGDDVDLYTRLEGFN